MKELKGTFVMQLPPSQDEAAVDASQTAGGLLMAVAPEDTDALFAE